MDFQWFEQIISQRRNDVTARFSRFCLAGLEIPYFSLVSCRNLLYDIGLKKTSKIGIPVISVGNLTMGGTGKTPFVIWLIRKCLEMGVMPAVASRGYCADESGWNDETRELAFHFDNLPQAISPKRYTAIQKMLSEAEEQGKKIDVVILDDGFQHRQLHRDLDIVLIDALNPFGYGHVFPRGMLRESISSLKRADIAILTRSDFIEEAEKTKIRHHVLSMNSNLKWCEIIHTPNRLVSLSNKRFSVEDLRDKNVLAFCGLGNPENFLKTLDRYNICVIEFMRFPDHYNYEQKTIDDIAALCQKKGLHHIVCTTKDLMKIKQWEFPELHLYAFVVETEVVKGKSELEQDICFLFK